MVPRWARTKSAASPAARPTDGAPMSAPRAPPPESHRPGKGTTHVHSRPLGGATAPPPLAERARPAHHRDHRAGDAVGLELVQGADRTPGRSADRTRILASAAIWMSTWTGPPPRPRRRHAFRQCGVVEASRSMAAADRVEFTIRIWPLLRRPGARPRAASATSPCCIWKWGRNASATGSSANTVAAQPQFSQLWIDARHAYLC